MRPLSCTFILITIPFQTPIIMKMIITFISNSTYFNHVNTFFTNCIKAVTYTLFFSLLIHFIFSRTVLSRCVQINHTQICQEFNVWIICIYSPAGRGLIDACSNCVTSTPPVSEWCIVNEITWVFTRIKRLVCYVQKADFFDLNSRHFCRFVEVFVGKFWWMSF